MPKSGLVPRADGSFDLTPSDGEANPGQCMEADVIDAGFISNTDGNCVSKDISIAIAAVTFYRYTTSDPLTPLAAGASIPCTPGQHVLVTTSAQIQNSAQSRYDVGLWIGVNGVDARTGLIAGDGSGTCNHYHLIPGVGGSTNLDPTADLCGDVSQSVNVDVPLGELDIICQDDPNIAGQQVTISACAGWLNSVSRGSTENICPLPNMALGAGYRQGTTQETPSKCKCNPLTLPLDIKASLTLVKTVTNDNGGTKVATDFALTASGPITITGVTGGTAVTGRAVDAGSYALTEATQAGYTASSWTCSGGTQTGSNIALAAAGSATCTISNNDNAPTLTLVKTITNDDGGTKAATDFALTGTGPVTITGATGGTAVTNRPVNAGSYALTEATQAGYTASSWSCTGGTQTGANIALALGGAATCTINNNDNAAGLTLVKVVTNDNGGTKAATDFALTASGPVTITGVTGGTAVTGRPVSAGSYALTEATQAGYTASTWSCTGGTQTGANIALGLGGSATCTISNNDIAPTLTLVKTVTNDNGGTSAATDFALTATGPVTITGATGGTAVTNRPVNAGSYALTEATQAGYTPSSWTCSGGTQTGANIALGLGGAATCTINNNDIAPTLTLVKTITNNDGGTKAATDFALTATGPVTITGATGGTAVTSRPVSAGSYALTEATQAGYAASTWSCTGGTQTGANIALGLGGSATCTINNNDIGAGLTLVKTITNDNGGTKAATDFALTASGPVTITGATGGTAVTGRPVPAGTYALTEATQAGYAASTWSCTGGTQTGANIALGLGGSATCTINNNDIAPTLTLVKTVTNDNGGTKAATDFALTGTGPVTITGATGGTAVTNRPVSAGSYALTEATQTGYTASTWSCTGGTQTGANIALALGGAATCTINNNDNPATLTVIKTVKGDGATFAFTGTGSGITANFNLAPATDASAQTVFNNLSAGTKTITETLLAHYVLTDLGCTRGGVAVGGPYDPLVTQTVSVTLTLGDNVVCTFVNEQEVGQTTRTQGFWATHESLTTLYWNALADKTLCGVTLDINQVLGGFWANIAQTTDKTKRTALDQARMRLLQQLLAAILNHQAFGSSPTGSISITDAKNAFCTGTLDEVQAAASAMAAFNEGGDSGVFTPGASANGKQAKTDANIGFWDTLP